MKLSDLHQTGCFPTYEADSQLCSSYRVICHLVFGWFGLVGSRLELETSVRREARRAGESLALVSNRRPSRVI